MLRQSELSKEDVRDEEVFREVFSLLGDDKETDISRLIRQSRIDYP